LAMKNSTSDVEQLREEMRRLRSHMDADVESFVENTKGLFDWHSYFQSAPWLCLGAAALTGYLLVPSKPRLVTVDLEKILDLAKHRQVEVKGQAVSAKGAGSGLSKLLVDLLLTTALAVAKQQLNQFLSSRQPPPGPSPQQPKPGYQPPPAGRR
jgi:hypothetical protein